MSKREPDLLLDDVRVACGIPPVDSAETAVKVAIAAKAKKA
jgi:hypothetical protein